MFTVHTKNKAPETGFADDPASSHKSEEAALAAAKELAQDPKTYGNTVMVCEKGTNRTWSVQYLAGQATVGYDEGTPYLVEGEGRFLTTYDAREEVVEVRQEEDGNGGVAIFLDQPHNELVGEFEQYEETA